MDFPILSLIDDERAEEWLLNHFHPQGLHCPHCDASVAEARYFRTTKTSRIKVYRCKVCDGVWTTVRNFLRPFRGVHKKFLSGYIAICEFAINLKSVTTEFISQLVQRTHL